jgi:hypothetical protein
MKARIDRLNRSHKVLVKSLVEFAKHSQYNLYVLLPSSPARCRTYEVHRETLGIARDGNGKSVALTLPRGSLLKVMSQESMDGTLDVAWNEKVVNIFAVDLQEKARAIE